MPPRLPLAFLMERRPAVWVPSDVMDEIQEEGGFPTGVYRWAAGTYLTGFDGGRVKDSVVVVGDRLRGELEEHNFKLGDLQVEKDRHYFFVLARPNWPEDFVPHFPCWVLMVGYRLGSEVLPSNIVKFLQPAGNLKAIHGNLH